VWEAERRPLHSKQRHYRMHVFLLGQAQPIPPQAELIGELNFAFHEGNMSSKA
jgi:hypothetical protein